MKSKDNLSVLWAILAALLYALSSPFSKLLLKEISPTIMASMLYLGAGIGMSFLLYIRGRISKFPNEQKLTRVDLPYTTGMIVLDIAAPIFLMLGLSMTTAANASLLNNFEIVATALIALLIFKETISHRLWIAIGLITLSSILISYEDMSSFSFSFGSLFVLLACICWGFENNCTRMISKKDPLQIVVIKGFGSGLGSFLIAYIIGERITNVYYIAGALLLGFVSYGLSILFYVYAQRELGATKTSAYYAIAPFIGVFFSFIIFQKMPSIVFMLALLVMIAGTYFTSCDTNQYKSL